MNVRYRVELSQSERDELTAMLSGGKHAARKLKRAQILLAADAGRRDEEIARAVAVGGSTVYRTKRRFVEGNLERALSEEPRPGADRKLTGKQEALLVATACANPPKGRARWTLELLAGALVKLTEHESLSRETVRRRLAENDLKPWRRDMWCIPQVDGEYVARMEDVLDLYAAAADPKRPVVCFDESPVQLIGEARQPIAAEPGQPQRYDYEYAGRWDSWRRRRVDRRSALEYQGRVSLCESGPHQLDDRLHLPSPLCQFARGQFANVKRSQQLQHCARRRELALLRKFSSRSARTRRPQRAPGPFSFARASTLNM
jgi:transposase